MAPLNDQPESASTLPRPELNPLVNPLLAENMGRWAEVYFTAPPEKRQEAVLELLKELESQTSAPGGRAKPQPAALPQTEHFPDTEVHSQIAAAEDAGLLARCQACGHDNPVSHHFCGMCGAKLSEEFLPQAVEEDLRQQPALQHRHFDRRSIGSNLSSRGGMSRTERQGVTSVDALDEHTGEPDALSPLRHTSENSFADTDTLNWNLEDASSRPYRIYIGAVLAVVLFALGYVAWRSWQTNQNAHQVSPARPVAASDASQQPAAPSPPPTTAPAPAPVPKADLPAATAAATQPAAPSPVVSAPEKMAGQRGEATSTPALLQANAEEASTFSGAGVEELATARRYLNGENGQERNTTEAERWLWKSVAKHNSEATLLLADLYLKGDGVSKNCDQARVLLDSAARKGNAGAGERLRHLPAFGCQ